MPSAARSDSELRRIDVPDGDEDITQTSDDATSAQGKFVCQRCYRDFEAHEQHKYEQHVLKCQD